MSQETAEIPRRVETEEERIFREAVLEKILKELDELNESVGSVPEEKLELSEKFALEDAHREAKEGIEELIRYLEVPFADVELYKERLKHDIEHFKDELRKLEIGPIKKKLMIFESVDRSSERFRRSELFRQGLVAVERQLTALNRAINSVSP